MYKSLVVQSWSHLAKNPWKIKLNRSVLCAQGILNEVSKSACSWTSKAGMGAPCGYTCFFCCYDQILYKKQLANWASKF